MSTPARAFSTSFESTDPSLTDEPVTRPGILDDTPAAGTSEIRVGVTDGPDSGYSAKRRMGFTGLRCLGYAGVDKVSGHVHVRRRILDANVTVSEQTQFSYKVFPRDVSDGGDLPSPGAAVALDLEFSDGSCLRELGARDAHGFILSAREYARADVLFAAHWNSVIADIGAVASGKTVTGIVIEYERDTEQPSEWAGWIDDVTITEVPPGGHREHLADWIDVRRGTNTSAAYSRGNNLPAIAVPHGFNFWTPVTDAGNARWPYHYQQQNGTDNLPRLQALALSHQAYPWGGDHHTVQFMPTTAAGLPNPDRAERSLAFRHDGELAHAHHYLVDLEGGLRAEIAPTDHAAIFRFRFPDTTGAVVFDNIGERSGGLHWAEDERRLVGRTGEGTDQMFIVACFDQDVVEAGGLQTGRQTGYCRFDTSEEPTVVLRVATSRISIDQASRNLDLEAGAGETFDSVLDRARALWDAQLGVITDLEGASDDQLVTFYSSLYRMGLYQNSAHENIGDTEAPQYVHSSPFLPPVTDGTDRETGSQVLEGTLYRSSGFWDTYRTTWPALALLHPEQTGELAEGVLRQFQEAGWFGTGMVGSCADASFAEIHALGVRNFDVRAAYEDVLLKHATVVSDRPGAGRPGLASGIFLGYTPLRSAPARGGGTPDEGMADALENYLGDFAIAQVAGSLHEETGVQRYADEYRYFLNRARNYGRHFDPSVGFFQGRHADGSWRLDRDSFDPCVWGYDYTETNAWGMAFAVPHDGQGLANLYGGREGLESKLDEFFSTPERADRPGSYGAVIHEIREAAAIGQGQWGLSNQPGFHIPYMYNVVGRPDKAHQIVRTALARQFTGSDIGQGYPGDEDTGSTSAWFVLSALGVYPLQVGTGSYVLTSPLFRKATIHLANGRNINVRAPQNSPDNVFIQGVWIDGAPYERTWLPFERLADGADIEFELGPEPSAWGSRPEDAPRSLTEGDAVPAPLRDLTGEGKGLAVIGTRASSRDGEVSAVALFDNTSDTAVTLPSEGASITWSFDAEGSGAPQMYTVTSAHSTTAPASWALEGSNDREHWVPLDERTEETFRWDRQTRPFAIIAPGAYRHYRWTFAGGDASDAVEIAELELLG